MARLTTSERSYHHGDLRRALIEEAVALIAEAGPANLSLREVARRAGVSHAAPRHHFGDKGGLLTAVATEGFRLLADELRQTYDRTGSFLEVGVAYVRFALAHRPYFEVMFRPDLLRLDDRALREAGGEAEAMLYGPLAEQGPGEAPEREVLLAGVAAWSLVHGLSTLLLNGNLPPDLAADPEATARAVAVHLRPPRSNP